MTSKVSLFNGGLTGKAAPEARICLCRLISEHAISPRVEEKEVQKIL